MAWFVKIIIFTQFKKIIAVKKLKIVVEKVSLDMEAIRQRQKEVISFFGKTSLWSSHTLFIKVVKIVVSDIVGSGI